MFIDPWATNWASNISKLLSKYNLPEEEKDIQQLSHCAWKQKVKRAIRNEALNTLLAEAKSKKKTSDMTYTNKLKPQKYLLSYNSNIATIIFKLRSRSVNCLNNRGSDGLCRLCGNAKETQEHAINCPKIASGGRFLDMKDVYGEVPLENNSNIIEIVERIELFEKILENRTDNVAGDPKK